MVDAAISLHVLDWSANMDVDSGRKNNPAYFSRIS